MTHTHATRRIYLHVAKWYFGLRIGPASLFIGWVNDATTKNYAMLLEKTRLDRERDAAN